MATRLARAEARWERLLQILEEMGYARVHTWDDAVQAARHGRRVYWTRHHWLGVGSSYVTVLDADTRITVRLSDHPQRPGGGLRYSAVLDDYDRAGESDVSIHPGSGVTLRNVRRHIEAALERARQELEAEDAEPTPAPATDTPAAPVVPAPVDPEVARARERLAAEKRARKRREQERRAAFRAEWQALRASLTPEHFARWRRLGNGRPGARALAAEMGGRPAVLYAALTNGGRY